MKKCTKIKIKRPPSRHKTSIRVGETVHPHGWPLRHNGKNSPTATSGHVTAFTSPVRWFTASRPSGTPKLLRPLASNWPKHMYFTFKLEDSAVHFHYVFFLKKTHIKIPVEPSGNPTDFITWRDESVCKDFSQRHPKPNFGWQKVPDILLKIRNWAKQAVPQGQKSRGHCLVIWWTAYKCVNKSESTQVIILIYTHYNWGRSTPAEEKAH